MPRSPEQIGFHTPDPSFDEAAFRQEWLKHQETLLGGEISREDIEEVAGALDKIFQEVVLPVLTPECQTRAGVANAVPDILNSEVEAATRQTEEILKKGALSRFMQELLRRVRKPATVLALLASMTTAALAQSEKPEDILSDEDLGMGGPTSPAPAAPSVPMAVTPSPAPDEELPLPSGTTAATSGDLEQDAIAPPSDPSPPNTQKKGVMDWLKNLVVTQATAPSPDDGFFEKFWKEALKYGVPEEEVGSQEELEGISKESAEAADLEIDQEQNGLGCCSLPLFVLLLPLLIAMREGLAHKKEAAIRDPASKSWDNMLLGSFKSLLYGGSAVGIGTTASLLMAGLRQNPELIGPLCATLIPATMVLLHDRTITKRDKNIDNASLDQAVLDDLFDSTDPDGQLNQKKLDVLWNLYKKAEHGHGDEKEKACKELEKIMGWGDQTVEHKLMAPVEEARLHSRNAFVRFFLWSSLPKVPKGAAGSGDDQSQKEAFFNALIRNATSINPFFHHKGPFAMLPFRHKGPKDKYYIAPEAAHMLLDQVDMRTFDDRFPGDPGWTLAKDWRNDADIVTALIQNGPARGILATFLATELTASSGDPALATYLVTGDPTKPPVMPAQLQVALRNDATKFESALTRITEISSIKRGLILNNLSTGPGRSLVLKALENKAGGSVTIKTNGETKRINSAVSKLKGTQVEGLPGLEYIDAILQFFPNFLIPGGERTKNLLNLTFLAIRWGKWGKIKEALKAARPRP